MSYIFSHSPTEGHVGIFYVLIIVNSAALTRLFSKQCVKFTYSVQKEYISFINVVITAMIIMMFCIGIEPVTQQMQNRHYEHRATHHAYTRHPEAVIESLLGF